MTNNQKKGLIVAITLSPIIVLTGVYISWWAPLVLFGGGFGIVFWLWFCLGYLSKKLGVED